MSETVSVEIRSFLCRIVVAPMLAPLLIAFSKSLLADAADAFAVPKGGDEIHPFPVPVVSLWAGKQFVAPGKTLSVRKMRLLCSATLDFM